MSLVRRLSSPLLGLLLICPACRRGRMGESLFTIRRMCPSCGVIFEKNPGEVTGGMAINMVLTSILGLAAVIYGVLFSPLDAGLVLAIISAVMVLFGLFFHRHARGLWVGVLHATGAIAEA